ncbi:MAG TPA: hypothetical protein VKC54_00010 [Patescibacteria group bacterium]|nr:hypothetical protein [Patescibacteria group bacterium]
MSDRGPEQFSSEERQARAMGEAFAKAMGTPRPERQLENFEKYEEHGEEFHIKPGTELPFMVLYTDEDYEVERRKWEYRSILSTARARKNDGASVDSVANPSPEERGLDPLGVEFKKERLEFLWREMPGLLAATCVYTEITAGKEFVGYMPGERKRRLAAGEKTEVSLESVRESLLSVSMSEPTKGKWKADDVLDHDELSKVYTDSEILDLIDEQQALALGRKGKTHTKIFIQPECPDSVYDAKEPAFTTLRESVRFFFKTKGVNLLFVNDDERKIFVEPNIDKLLEEHGAELKPEKYEQLKKEAKAELNQRKVQEIARRSREAEQAAWNFIYAMGIIESNNLPDNNQYIRDHGNKALGPSNFMTLYMWMAMHPQIRFEKKVKRDLDGGEDDAKENWASLGSWAAYNIQNRSWSQPVLEKGVQKRQWELNLDGAGKPILDTSGNETEILKPVYETIIPKFIRPNLVYDGLREESNNRAVMFDYFVEKGELILRKPTSTGLSHEELYEGLVVDRKIPQHVGVPTKGDYTWKSLPDSPFVNYRFDRLRWTGVIYNIFKKGDKAIGKIDIDELAESGRMLGLTAAEKIDLLKMFNGINTHTSTIQPAMGPIAWNTYLNRLKRVQDDLFVDSSNERTEL